MKSKKIIITTDSNSGFSPAEAEKHGVRVIPMPFLIDGEPYFENVNLTQEEFYKKLKNGGNVATSQPSPGDLTELWTELLQDYDEIVHLPMSSALSQSCATAKIIAADFDNRVFVVDNKRISVTLKESVLDALALIEKGLDAKDIQKQLEETGADSSIYIALDTMKYLKKGGRITPAAAAIATVLKIRPVLQIQGDRLDKFALCRTKSKSKDTMKEAIVKDLSSRFQEFVQKGEMTISVAHTDNAEEAEQFAEELKKAFPSLRFRFCEPLSLSVSCHIGPGALAVALTRSLA